MTASQTGVPASTRPGRVALKVGDLDRLVDFYADVVGLSLQSRDEQRAVLSAGGDPLLELHAAPDAPDRGRDETGLFHTAFLVPTRAALGDALTRVENQWRLDGASDHHVSEALYLSDPEGNGIEVYCDRPREEWPVDDGHVEMETLPLALDPLRDRATGADAVPPGTTVGHVHLEVSSLPESHDFYVDVLGFDVRQQMGSNALFLATDDYHHHLGLNTWNGRTAPPSGRGLAWVELVVPDQSTADALRTRLDANGHETTDTPNGFGVADPDGIDLRIVTRD